jgi:hypothetical protein
MGAPAIRIFAGRSAEGLDREKAFGYVTDAIKRCCDYSGEHGVYLGIENHGYSPSEQRICCGSWTRSIIRGWHQPGHRQLRDRPYDNIALAAPKRSPARSRSSWRTEKGDGREPADLNRIVGILRKANYQGYLTLEYEGKEEPKTPSRCGSNGSPRPRRKLRHTPPLREFKDNEPHSQAAPCGGPRPCAV